MSGNGTRGTRFASNLSACASRSEASLIERAWRETNLRALPSDRPQIKHRPLDCSSKKPWNPEPKIAIGASNDPPLRCMPKIEDSPRSDANRLQLLHPAVTFGTAGQRHQRFVQEGHDHQAETSYEHPLQDCLKLVGGGVNLLAVKTPCPCTQRNDGDKEGVKHSRRMIAFELRRIVPFHVLPVQA